MLYLHNYVLEVALSQRVRCVSKICAQSSWAENLSEIPFVFIYLFIWHTTYADVRKPPTYRNLIFSGQIWRTKKSTYDIWKNICRTLLQCMEPVCICTMENVPLKVVSNWPQKLHFVLHAAAALSALVKVKFVKKKFVKKIHQKNSSNFFFVIHSAATFRI